MDLDQPTNRNLKRIQELEALLQHPSSLQGEIDALAELAWELRISQPDRAEVAAQKAIELAQNEDRQNELYKMGYATALVALANVELQAGHIDEGVKKCLQALNSLSDLPSSTTTIRIWFTLGWNSFFLGEYPTAMEQALKALHMSDQLGLSVEKAWALDAVGSIYGITNDFTNAIKAHQEAVRIFQEQNDVDGTLRSTNNLAMTYYVKQKYVEALEYANSSLQVARKWSRKYDELNICCTMAQISIEMGQLEDANHFLHKAFANAKILEKTYIYHVFVLMEWARLYLKQNDLQNAKSNLIMALKVAEENNQKSEQAQCHESLSEIYEHQGDYKRSLEHHKAFHAINEEVSGERAAARLSVLTITHQIDSARQEAEIYRLKAEQFQSEMEEQKRIKELMENLSRVDSLTGLANRRHFDERLSQEYARHSRTRNKLSLILLDIDHFKPYNDTYGHLKGDECLKQIAQVIRTQVTRITDLAARFGGEEFICILPDTDETAAVNIAEQIRQAVHDLAIPHKASQTSNWVTISLGIVTAKCHEKGSPVELIAKADQQLYVAKSGGRNCISATMTEDGQNFLHDNDPLIAGRSVWQKSYESGNPIIDSQHRELYELINQLLDLSHTQHPLDNIAQMISNLLDRAIQHFQDEENILAQVNYSELHQHATEHSWLAQRGADLFLRFKDGIIPLEELMDYLSEEMIAGHMLQADRKFFPILKNETR